MQSLLEDPEFYKLLVNNTESLISSKSSSPQSLSSSVGEGHNQNIPDYKNKNTSTLQTTHTKKQNNNQSVHDLSHSAEQVDFSFLKKLEFPTLKSKNNSNNMMHSSVASETSYQSSIFSAPYSATQLPKEPIENFSSMDEFFSKDISLQINNEMNHSFNMEQPLGYQTTTAAQFQQLMAPFNVHTEQESKPNFPTIEAYNNQVSQKQFHKFYTSSLKRTPPSMGITKPSSSSSPLGSSPSSSTAVASYHRCPFCQRQFKNKSYLSRHLKKHDTIKEFKCPFFHEDHAKCHHLNGEFSRKDTFKAHLKSIHFIYPVGVFKCDRNLSIGRCAGCFKEFSNNSEWLTKHIEAEECPSLAKFKNFEVEK